MNGTGLAMVLLVAVAVMCQPLFADEPEYVWTCVTTEAPFAPREGAGALSFDGRMWLIGGWNPDDKEHFPSVCSNDVWSSTDGRDWTCVKPNTVGTDAFDAIHDWQGRHSAGYVVLSGAMWIFGSDAIQRHYQPDAWRSANGRDWQRVTDILPWGNRVLQYTVVLDEHIYAMGGQAMPQLVGGRREEHFFNDVWVSDEGVDWHRLVTVEPMWPPRGMIGGSGVFKGRIWILGGGTHNTPRAPRRRYYNDVWSSDDGMHWARHLEHAPWYPRQDHDVAVFDDRLWVLAGYHERSGDRNDVWYSSDGINWKELPDTPWKPRHAAGVFVHNGSLWIVAGSNMESDVWRLDRRKD